MLETQWLSSDLPASASSPGHVFSWAQGTRKHLIHATAYLQMLRKPRWLGLATSVCFAHSGLYPPHFCFLRYRREGVLFQMTQSHGQ